MFDYNMDHIMSYNATLTSPEIIGEVPEGLRANFYVTGGTIPGLPFQVAKRGAG